MFYIFDLDYTLLDTANFKIGLSKALGLTIDEFNRSYKKYFKDERVSYNVDSHIIFLTQDKEQIEKSIKPRLEKFFLTIDKYLYSEAENILKKIKERGHKLALFTYGDIVWQKRKTENLKIKKYFDYIIYTDRGKRDINIQKIAGKKLGCDAIIVNDNAKECLEIKRNLPKAEIFLIKSQYSNNAKHNFKIRKLEELMFADI